MRRTTFMAAAFVLWTASAFAQGLNVNTGGTVAINAGGTFVTNGSNDVTVDGGRVELNAASSALEVGRDLTVTATAGSTLISAAVASTIRVGEDWSDSGAWTPGSSTVIFNGGAAQTINKVVAGVTVNQTETFYNLTCAKSAGTLTTFDSDGAGAGDYGDRITTTNDLTVSGGTLDLDPDTTQIQHTVTGNYLQNGGSLKADTIGNSANLACHLDVLGNFTVTSGTFTGTTAIITQEINVAGNVTLSTAFLYHGWLRLRGPVPNASDDSKSLNLSAGAKVRVLNLWLQENSDEYATTGTVIGEYVPITTGGLQVGVGSMLTIQNQADAGFTSGDTGESDVLGTIRFDGSLNTSYRRFVVSGGTVNAYAIGFPATGSNDGVWWMSAGTVNLTKSPNGYKGAVVFQNNDDADSAAPQVYLSGGDVNLTGNWTMTDADPQVLMQFSASAGTVTWNGTGAQSITHSPEVEYSVGQGTGFYNFTVNNTAAASDVTLMASAGVKNVLTVADGTFALTNSVIVLTLGTTAASAVVNVNLNGVLKTDSGAVNQPTITAAAAGFRHDFNVLGTLDINGLVFQYANASGMDVQAGATVTQLDYVNFLNGTGRHLSITHAGPLTINARGCYFDATTNNVSATDTAPNDNVRANFESRTDALHGPGRGDANDLDEDTGPNDDGFSDAPVGGAVVNWVWAFGTVQGYPQAAMKYKTDFSWYATYFATYDGGTSTSYIMVDKTGDGYPDYDYTFATTWVPPGEATAVGSIVGPVWWDYNEPGTYWLYFGTSNGYIIKLNDTGAALTLAWALDLKDVSAPPPNFAPTPCSSVTSPVVSNGDFLYFGGTAGAGDYRVYCLQAVGGAEPTGWYWAPNPSVTSPLYTAPAIWGPWGSNMWLYAASAVDTVPAPDSSHIYRVMTSSGAVDGNYMGAPPGAPIAYDIKAGLSVSGFISYSQAIGWGGSPATMKVVVGDYGGKMYMVDADAAGFGAYAGWPYLYSGHAYGDVSIPASAMYDPLEERTYFGDSDGHIFVVEEDDGPDVGSMADEFNPGGGAYPIQLEAGFAVTAAPLVEDNGVANKWIYTGNSNGKFWKIDRNAKTSAVTRNIGVGLTVYDIAYLYTVPAKIAFSASNGKTYYVDP